MSKKLVNIINIFFIVLLLIQNTNQLKKPMITEGNRLFSKMSPFGEGGNTMSGLNIETTNDSKSGIILGTPNDFFSFVIAGNTNNLELNHNEENILIFNKNNEIEIFPKIITLNNGMDFSGNLKIRGVDQWKLFKEEDFSYEANGWSNNTVSSCAGINMMGGYCKYASGETWKLFENIPPHKQIKIEATFHFIDAWSGETGYMKIGQNENDMEYFWTEKYNAFQGDQGVNICGGIYPEGKFASLIDVSLEHEEDKIRLSFGSTLQSDACENSFGISALKIYIR